MDRAKINDVIDARLREISDRSGEAKRNVAVARHSPARHRRFT